MKNQMLFLALGTLFLGQVYSSDHSEPTVEQAMVQQEQLRSVLATEMLNYRVIHHPTYAKARLGAKNAVTNKAAVTVNQQNIKDVTKAFIDSLGEALEETGTAVDEQLDAAIEAFKATLKEQKNIIGGTAKDLLNIFKNTAEGLFPSTEFAVSLEEKIKNMKFITGTGGNLEAVKREQAALCCGILSCVLGTSYNYLQRQYETEPVAYPPRLVPNGYYAPLVLYPISSGNDEASPNVSEKSTGNGELVSSSGSRESTEEPEPPRG